MPAHQSASYPGLAIEARLLLLTAAAAPSVPALRAAIGAGVDWKFLVQLAQSERAEAVALRALAPLDAAAAAVLRGPGTDAAIRLLELERLLHQALDVLAAKGIDAMLLKGAGLAYTAYPAFIDRPMGDLDVLVRPEQAEAAWRLLQQHGWGWPADRWELSRYTAHQHWPPLLHEPGEFRLEIHTEMLPAAHPFHLPVAAIWARGQTVERNGRRLLAPHALHQLWHACVHFAWSHEMRWGAWRTLRDVAALVQQPSVVWDEVVQLARDTRAVTCCFWTLQLARRLVGAAVPDGVLAALHPSGAAFILDALERHYTVNLFPSADGCPSVWLSRRLWETGIQPGRSGHRAARPWQVTEQWVAGGAAPARVSGRRTLAARLLRVGSWLAYARRVRRLALPDY